MAQITLDKLAHSYLANPKTDSDFALKEIDYVWDDGGAYALLGPSANQNRRSPASQRPHFTFWQAVRFTLRFAYVKEKKCTNFKSA